MPSWPTHHLETEDGPGDEVVIHLQYTADNFEYLCPAQKPMLHAQIRVSGKKRLFGSFSEQCLNRPECVG